MQCQKKSIYCKTPEEPSSLAVSHQSWIFKILCLAGTRSKGIYLKRIISKQPGACKAIDWVKFKLCFSKKNQSICLGISYYKVNQKLMSPRTNFHCETIRSACSSERNSAIFCLHKNVVSIYKVFSAI